MTSAARASAQFDDVLRNVDALYLRPRPAAVSEAKIRADALVEELDRGRAWMYRVVRVHEHGSLSRGTGIRFFNDLDRLVELDPAALRTRAGHLRTARDTIARMASHIRARRAGLVSMGSLLVRSQEHSVGIKYPGRGLRIDLVPAVRESPGFLIPEQGTGHWITTDPEATVARLQQAKATAPHTGMAIRLLKGWVRARGRNASIPSFAVEVLVVDRALQADSTLTGLVEHFFREVAGAHAGRRLLLGRIGERGGAVTVIDPVSGNNITEAVTGAQRKSLVYGCRVALVHWENIRKLAVAGRSDRAVVAAKRLFAGRWA